MTHRGHAGIGGKRRKMSKRVLRGFSPDALRAARHAARLSRSELARLSDVSPGAIRTWEIGEVSPQVDTLYRVARVLDVQMAELIPIPDDELQLIDLRVRRGWTQPQLATAAGLSTTALAGLERATTRLREAQAQALATALGVSVEDVMAAYQRSKTRPPEKY